MYYDVQLLASPDTQEANFTEKFKFKDVTVDDLNKFLEHKKQMDKISDKGGHWNDLRLYFNGLGRVLIYKKNNKRNEIQAFWEGQLKEGFLSGFGRDVQVQKDRCFVGFFDASQGTNNYVIGPGYYFEQGKLKYKGMYKEG